MLKPEAMRSAAAWVVLGLLSGCSVSAGAGARFGVENYQSPECDSFESCDVAYQAAVENAQRCHDEGDDCDDEDRNVRATYGALREHTAQELGALRDELEQRNAAGDSQELEQPERSRSEREMPGHAPETPPAPRHGNTWFESDTGSEY